MTLVEPAPLTGVAMVCDFKLTSGNMLALDALSWKKAMLDWFFADYSVISWARSLIFLKRPVSPFLLGTPSSGTFTLMSSVPASCLI